MNAHPHRRPRRKRTFKAGDHVVLGVRCEHMHLWTIKGTMGEDGRRIECGAITAPNAPDDPTCCPTCRQPFAVTYFVMADE